MDFMWQDVFLGKKHIRNKNKFTGRKRNLQIGRNRILNQNLGYKNQNMKTVQEEEHG